MTLLDTGRSKFMSWDVGLIGLLRYFPLAQFTKARLVDFLGPFSLAFPRNRYCHGSKLPVTRSCAVHTTTNAMTNSIPCATLRVPQALGGDPTTPTHEDTRCL